VLVSGFLYTVRAASLGRSVWISVFRLCGNTLKSARAYLTDAPKAGEKSFYISLTVVAVLAILSFLAATLFAVYAAWLYVRALRASRGSEEERRTRILFRAVFPHRALLFLSHCPLVLTALYPELFSMVCTRYLRYSGGTAIDISYNITLIGLLALLTLTLVLAVGVRSYEREEGVDLFCIKDRGAEEKPQSDPGEHIAERDTEEML